MFCEDFVFAGTGGSGGGGGVVFGEAEGGCDSEKLGPQLVDLLLLHLNQSSQRGAFYF